MNVSIRPATGNDLDAVAQLEAHNAHHPWTLQSIHSSHTLDTTRIWLAHNEEALVGHLIASAVADEGQILTVVVDRMHRRQGVGRMLVGHCMAAWQTEGVALGFLEVRIDNRAAARLYEDLGWKRTGTRPRYYPDGADAYVLAWEASP
jgi:[ribosomal protein S18]-alanine N-acetyltransferase